MFNRDLSKGSAELLVLTLLEARPRHGYDLGKLIEERTEGLIRFSHRIALPHSVSPRGSRPDCGPLAGKIGRAAATPVPADAGGTQVFKGPT
jgi:hypothetical protein